MTIQIRKLSFLTNEPVYQNVPDVKRTQEILLFFVLVVLVSGRGCGYIDDDFFHLNRQYI